MNKQRCTFIRFIDTGSGMLRSERINFYTKEHLFGIKSSIDRIDARKKTINKHADKTSCCNAINTKLGYIYDMKHMIQEHYDTGNSDERHGNGLLAAARSFFSSRGLI